MNENILPCPLCGSTDLMHGTANKEPAVACCECTCRALQSHWQSRAHAPAALGPDLRSAFMLLDSLDRIAEDFKTVEPCRHNNDNIISDLKIELAGLREALSVPPSAATASEPRAWECTDETHPYMMGHVTLNPATVKAWDSGAIKYVGLVREVPRSAASTEEPLIAALERPFHEIPVHQYASLLHQAAKEIRRLTPVVGIEPEFHKRQMESASAALARHDRGTSQHDTDGEAK